MRSLCLLILLTTSRLAFAQPNCQALLFAGDTAAYRACMFLDTALNSHYQYEQRFQEICDEALRICPHFAYAWREKSTPYVKAGNYVLWLRYMNEAVRFDTLGMLPVRASCRGKFFGDYAGAIADIDLFEKLYPGTLAMAHNGTYSLAMVKALSLRELNRKQEALETAQAFLAAYPQQVGMYDWLHVGMLHLALGDTLQAQKCLQHQLQQTPLAEAAYQLARLALAQQQIALARSYVQQARRLFNGQQKLFDPYHYLSDQLYETELLTLEQSLR